MDLRYPCPAEGKQKHHYHPSEPPCLPAVFLEDMAAVFLEGMGSGEDIANSRVEPESCIRNFSIFFIFSWFRDKQLLFGFLQVGGWPVKVTFLYVKFLPHSGLTRQILPSSNRSSETLIDVTVRYPIKKSTSISLAHSLHILKII